MTSELGTSFSVSKGFKEQNIPSFGIINWKTQEQQRCLKGSFQTGRSPINGLLRLFKKKKKKN